MITISLLVALLLLITGVAYSAWRYVFTGNENRIETGSISLKLLESNTNIIDLKNELPKSDEEGIKQSTFDFSVITKATYNTKMGYDIKIEKLNVDTGYTSLNNDQIKIYLTDYNDKVLVNPTLISDLPSNTIYSRVNEHTPAKTEEIDKYKIRVWIDKNVDASNWTKDTKQEYKFRIGVLGGENRLVGLTKQIADSSVLDNKASTYVSASTGINFAEAPSDTNGKGIYQRAGTGENGEYPVYYYRGNVDNNNLAYNGFCWKIVRTTETGGIKLIYNGSLVDGQCGNGGTYLTSGVPYNYNSGDSSGTSVFSQKQIDPTTLEQTNQSAKQKKLADTSFDINDFTPSAGLEGSSPADVGYMYGKRYLSGYLSSDSLPSTVIYGNDVTYSNGKYTLKDTITSTNFATDQENIGKNHHYFCADGTSSCNIVYYIYQVHNSYLFYIKLGDGNNIEQALKEMLTESTNENSSTVKQLIDYWYNGTMSEKTDELEDTIWCNDRSIYNKGGFDKDQTAGGSSYLLFNVYSYIDAFDEGTTINPSLKCPSKNDSFTVSAANGNGKLSYPVALLTGAEATLAGNGPGYSSDSYLTTGNYFWLSSPYGFRDGLAFVSNVRNDGGLTARLVDDFLGLRPSVSLKLGTSISGGNGTNENPYIVGEQPTQVKGSDYAGPFE